MTTETTTKFPLARDELRPFLEAFPGFDSGPPPAEGVRLMLAAFPPPPMPDAETVAMSNVEIPGPGGEQLRLLVLRPTKAEGKTLPAVLCAHGGGLIMAPPELDLVFYTFLAEQGYLVVSVDYRLAPEHRAPAALEDVHAAFRYVTSAEGAKRIGGDANKIALYGSSAGGTLMAGVALRLNQEKGQTQPAVVMLDCPALDDRMKYPSDAPGNRNEPYHIWTRQNALDSAKHVFGESTKRSVETAPLSSSTVEDFKGLGPHYISWADLDVLADQAPAYADALEAAGVECERKEWKGTYHVFMTLQPQASVSQKSQQRYLSTLQKHLPLE
ncbi:hypothetical protein QFC22_005144 [Naganishia vaughanmartiniae]|uniref:Uncharacterized protein n=1 Tax=Naganishia vaughanmartiniae TaxID=1424756 RepID=A0ACC2WUD4_9TREE|nr:hypothetical protein QFC22_005144 [Naganishia vaughanmartiniae]